MKTSTIPIESELDKKAEKLLTAANEYYKEYQKVFRGGGAVIYLHDHSTKNTVVFTRGEYLNEVSNFVESLPGSL